MQMEKSHVLLRRKTSALNKSKIQGLDTQTRPQGAQGQARIGGPSEMLRIVDNYPGLFKTFLHVCPCPHSMRFVQNGSPRLPRSLGLCLVFLESFIPCPTNGQPYLVSDLVEVESQLRCLQADELAWQDLHFSLRARILFRDVT